MRVITFIPSLWKEVIDGNKTQTRRRGRRWLKLRRGDRFRVFRSGVVLEMTKDAYLERLQSISKRDLVREGIRFKANFSKAWDDIYREIDPRWHWKANPQVVVLNFKVIKAKKNGV